MGSFDRIVTTVIKCARCGDDHYGMAFSELAEPVADRGGIWTHVGLCQNSGDTVFLRIDFRK